jgi:hypothetical protein
MGGKTFSVCAPWSSVSDKLALPLDSPDPFLVCVAWAEVVATRSRQFSNALGSAIRNRRKRRDDPL